MLHIMMACRKEKSCIRSHVRFPPCIDVHPNHIEIKKYIIKRNMARHIKQACRKYKGSDICSIWPAYPGHINVYGRDHEIIMNAFFMNPYGNPVNFPLDYSMILK